MIPLQIRDWASMDTNGLLVNGTVHHRFQTDELVGEKLQGLYKQLGIAYPKFYKMDHQCQVGWLTAEALCKEGKLFDATVAPEEVALVLSNASASLDTDVAYESSLHREEEFLPSPAVFVYTLANIVAGEICIRHGIKGENNFFVSESFDAATLCRYVELLFEEKLCRCCLVGWVEVYGESFKSMLALVEPIKEEGEKGILFTEENLNQLYKMSVQI